MAHGVGVTRLKINFTLLETTLKDINIEKLREIINEEISDITTGMYSFSTRVLFNDGDYQIQLVTTRDWCDFIEQPNPDDIVIFEPEK